MSLKVFYSSVSSSAKMRENQQKIFKILDGMKLEYKCVDISLNPEVKDLMRQLVGDQTALPPQIFNGDNYCGNLAEFEYAIEQRTLENFLKLQMEWRPSTRQQEQEQGFQ